MIKAIGFDVGHTLINYRNPLNWRTLYRSALEQAARGCGISLSETKKFVINTHKDPY